MKPKKASGGLIITDRQSSKPEVEEKQEDNPNDDIEVCAIDLLKAIMDKDVKAMAIALKAAHCILSSQPEEQEAEEPETIDFHTQNIKAAQENR